MFGIGGTDSGGPLDYLRGRVDSWRAHPFQNIASSVAGAFGGPAAGWGANQLFDRYNSGQFNNAANQFRDNSLQQTTMDANSAMNSPLSGPLGEYDRKNPFGEGSGGGYGGDLGLQQGGSSGGSPFGGYNGPTQSGSAYNWGDIQNSFAGLAPQQPSQFVNDILNSISAGPGLPGTGNFGGGPSARRDNAGMGMMPGMGISQFSPGMQVITGYGDPNSRYRYAGTDRGG